MKKHICRYYLLFITAIIVLALLPYFISGISKASANEKLGKQANSVVDALKFQAKDWAEKGHESTINADTHTATSTLEDNLTNKVPLSIKNFPSKFDLRNCDLDGNGQYKNYVTSTKLQNPWGTCWAHAGIAASESSILSKTRTNSWYIDENGNKRDSLDLSEHHLSWFNYTPMTEQNTLSQAGEGAYSLAIENAIKTGVHKDWSESQRLMTGGVGLSVISTFSRGSGPVIEPDWYNPNLTSQQKQLLYIGKNNNLQKDARKFDVFSRDDDWSIDNSQWNKHDFELDNAYKLPDAAAFDNNGNYSIENADYVTQLMKEQLLQGRGVAITYNCDTFTYDQADHMWPRYINVDTWAEYAYEPGPPEHLVTVVGWDDNFSKSNFLTEVPLLDDKKQPQYDPSGKMIMKKVNQPPKDGAWIVKNSWGAKDSIAQGLSYEPWGYQDSGYFFLSYYDQSLVDEVTYDFNVDAQNNLEKTIYQHNYMSCETTKSIDQKDKISTANVFCADQDENICEVSCITSKDNENVTYQLYLLDTKDQKIDNGKLLCTINQNYKNRGFHRASLNNAYQVNKGQYFAVVTTHKNKDNYLLDTWYDCNRKGKERKMNIDYYYCKGIVNPGESFIYTASDDKWTDWADIKNILENSEEGKYFSYDNFAIKAYGTLIKSPDVPGGDVTPANNPVDSGINGSTAPGTGDSMQINLFIIIVLLGCLSLGFSIYQRKAI